MEARNSFTSFTSAEKRRAFSAYSASCSSSSPYSFSVDPQPPALVMIASKPSIHAEASIFRRASLRASSRIPACTCKAPQQPWLAGIDHFTAILLQHTHGGFVQTRETDVRDASAEKRHAIPPLTFGRQRLAVVSEEKRRFDLRRQSLHLAQPRRKKTRQAGQPLQAAGLIQDTAALRRFRDSAGTEAACGKRASERIARATAAGFCFRFRRAPLPPIAHIARPMDRPSHIHGMPGKDRCARCRTG